MLSIGTIAIPTHTKLVSKVACILDLNTIEPIPKQLVEPICVLVVNLAIPPNIIKQHLLKTFFHLEVGEMIIDGTPTWE
jgi:hypothetical protein